MRLLFLFAALVASISLSACQTTSDEPDGKTYSKSSANKARTDDPIAALQKY